MKLVIPFFLSFMLCFTVFAGDLPEAVVTLSDVDVFIGEITEISDEKTTIAVYEALFNNYDVDAITVHNFQYMTYDENHRIPKVGDYVAVAAEYRNNAWEIAYGSEDVTGDRFSGLVAKSDGTDPETLKLYDGGYGFTERMNVYINDGTYSYENRMRVLGLMNENKAVRQEDRAGDKDAETQKLAEETQIVVPPPVAAKDDGERWYEIPFVRYTFLTLFSALVSFTVSKGVAKRVGR